MLSGKLVAVVVPAFEEADRIARTVRSMPGFVDLIVVVDDASADGTSEAARATGDPRLCVVRHAENLGVGAAIRTGYREARARGAFVVAVMAGDGQMDPADLPAVLGPVLAGEADYVKGNRLVHPQAGDMPTLRRAGTTALGWATARAVGIPGLGDSQCGYTAIAGAILDRLPLDRLWARYGYPNNLLGLVAAAGGRVVEVPVRPVYAGERSGLRPWHVALILGLIARAHVRRVRAREAGRGRRAQLGGGALG